MSHDIPHTSGRKYVTPQMAAAWLERNTEMNRRLSQNRVDTIATSITEGRWKLTHQGIAFDVEGNLVDGQHRLAAIVQAGIKVPLWVHVGLARDIFSVIDVGQTRTATQFLTGGYRYDRGSAARILYQVEHGFTTAKVPMDVLLAYEETWEPELADYAHPAKRIARETPKGLSTGLLLSVFVQTAPTRNSVDPSTAAEFLEAFTMGSAQKSPVGSLIKKAGQQGATWGGGSNKHVPYRYMVMTWNAWAAGATNLSFPGNRKATDPIPEVFGLKK